MTYFVTWLVISFCVSLVIARFCSLSKFPKE